MKVVAVPKKSAEDTTLVTVDQSGNPVVVPVPSGTGIAINIVGLHYNRAFAAFSRGTRTHASIIAARYWEDPHAFKPERFLGNYSRDAFLPFSSGARSCLGRRYAIQCPFSTLDVFTIEYRFFETEGIAILTMLIARYKVDIKEEPEFAGETCEERRARLLQAKQGLTLRWVQ